VSSCPEHYTVAEEDEAMLVCFLVKGHDGLHFDQVEDLSWKMGAPDD
jgi:hypothetical protein